MKENKDAIKQDREDIFLWSKGTWCYRYEYKEMNHSCHDFSILHFDSKEYQDLLKEYQG